MHSQKHILIRKTVILFRNNTLNPILANGRSNFFILCLDLRRLYKIVMLFRKFVIFHIWDFNLLCSGMTCIDVQVFHRAPIAFKNLVGRWVSNHIGVVICYLFEPVFVFFLNFLQLLLSDCLDGFKPFFGTTWLWRIIC